MSNLDRDFFDTMIERVRTKERELLEMKRAVNTFLKDAGKEPVFAETEEKTALATGAPLKIRADQFFNRPLATAAREYLELKGQACSVEEVLSALERGGFDFGKVTDPGYRQRGLAISLAKNSGVFVKLPNGTFGLKAAYPGLKRDRAANGETEVDE